MVSFPCGRTGQSEESLTPVDGHLQTPSRLSTYVGQLPNAEMKFENPTLQRHCKQAVQA